MIAAVNAAGSLEGLADSFPKVPVLSMLNDKYVILDDKVAPVVNPNAMGTAWFVDSAAQAGSVNDEISKLSSIDLHTTAVVGPDFKWAAEAISACEAKGAEAKVASWSDTIYMTSYAPNE